MYLLVKILQRMSWLPVKAVSQDTLLPVHPSQLLCVHCHTCTVPVSRLLPLHKLACSSNFDVISCVFCFVLPGPGATVEEHDRLNKRVDRSPSPQDDNIIKAHFQMHCP